MYTSNVLFSIFLFVCSSVAISSGCSKNEIKRLVIEESAVVDLSASKGCSMIIETSTDQILAFQPVSNTSLESALKFIIIQDGVAKDATYLTLNNSNTLNPDVRHNQLAYNTMYTKSNLAKIWFSDEIPEGLLIKISKAVNCPFNLGLESQCGRIVDAESCYCATFTKRNWLGQRDYCLTNGYKFLALESFEEENAIHEAWGTATSYWISLNDRANEGVWIWDSPNNARLYPGYANWKDGEPNDAVQDAAEDCGELTISRQGWNDVDCALLKNAICELHPY